MKRKLRNITISRHRRGQVAGLLFLKYTKDVIIPGDHDDNTVTSTGESNVTSIRIKRSKKRGSIGNNPRNNGSLGMK